MRPGTSRLQIRSEFLVSLAVAVGSEHVEAIQELIDARVSEAVEDVCVPLAEHWRAGDTDELYTGGNDGLGECDCNCPVNALAESGLIYVPVLAKCPTCTGDREHYGECPADDGDVPELAGDTVDTL